MSGRSPFRVRNVRLFIAFRVFFNSRFYYPVFTILFLDYGLSIEQFSLLNTVWAVTIVCAEVPSGALADLLGRKRLLVITSWLMILEMSVIAFIPISSITLVFWAFLINRMLSGLAEAMASGADEAIAYDSLVQEGNPDQWPRVLGMQMRLKALAGIVTMSVGALVYDPATVNRLLAFSGAGMTVDQQVSMRFPVYLTLLLAVLALWSTLRMEETAQSDSDETAGTASVRQAVRLTLQAGRWILATPFALAVIMFGMFYDHLLRLIVTLTSQYFRLISLPEASFGVIMAALSLLGLIVPKGAEALAVRFGPGRNAAVLALLLFVALFGLMGFFPYLGLLPMALVMTGLLLTDFFTSHYLNRITGTKQRATVLSFKGLAFNLAYGCIGLLFALQMRYLRHGAAAAHPDWAAERVEHEAFREAFAWFPWYAAVLLALIVFWSVRRLRKDPSGHRDTV